MDKMNPLLRIQLKRAGFCSEGAVRVPSEEEWSSFLGEVSDRYDQFETQHDRLNRALYISTEEANEALGQMKAVNVDMEEALALMHEQMEGLMESYPDQINAAKEGERGMKGLVGQFRDLANTWHGLVNETEQGRALAVELRVKADAASEAKSSFLAAMSHEIRTPLNGVIGMAELMVGTDLTHDQREYVETIQTCGETLLSLIDGILDYSKIEAGEMQFEEKPFSLNSAIEDSIDMLRYVVSQKKVSLLFDLRVAGEHYFLGDETRFKQVVTNLIGNASKFTEEGEIVVEVKRNNLKNRKGDWLVRVKDTGLGIHEEELERLFQVFYQANSAELRTQGGTGLGLAISEKIVTYFGGEIWAESELGVGSVFSFTFTLPEVELKKPEAAKKQNVGWIEGKRVMFVDDNETNLKILERQLSHLRAETMPFRSPITLLKEIEIEGLPDLLISDQEMPDMQGAELIKKVAAIAQEAGRTVPALLISSIPLSGVELPHTLTATKPLRRADLLRLLSDLGIEPEQEQQTSTKDTEESLFFDSFPYRVLVVEDNAINQRLVQLMLKRIGIEAEYVEDGEMAVAYVKKEQPDIILMDIQMPKMDGYQATEAIRVLKLPRQPVIMGLTANALTDERARAYRVGMDDYLTKPIVLKVLFQGLERASKMISESYTI